jgi:heat shock protein HtpX
MPLNYAKTFLLLAVLTGIFVAMGAAIGGQGGLVIAFIVAMVMNIVSLWKSDTMVLRMFRAQEVTDAQAPELVRIVGELAQRADLPMPRVYVMNAPQPNAFATGRSPSRSAVAFSTGLLDALTPEEIAGVAAHELAHIKNRDTLTMTVAATIGGAISMAAQYLQFGALFGGNRDDRGGGWLPFLFAAIVAPFAAMLVQMAISRSREYQADRLGAAICGNPRWLATALEKIHTLSRRIPNPAAESIPAAAHIFIVNPLTGRGIDSLFATHPNIGNRLAELQKIEQEMAGMIDANNWPSQIASGVSPANRSVARNGSEPQGSGGPWG